MRRLVLFALLIAASASAFAAPPLLDRAKLDRLNTSRVGSQRRHRRVSRRRRRRNRASRSSASMSTRRARASSSSTTRGEHELPQQPRIELIGSERGRRRARQPRVRSRRRQRARRRHDAARHVRRHAANASRTACVCRRCRSNRRTRPASCRRCSATDDAMPSGRPDPTALEIALTGQAPAGALRYAIVAVDTDNEFMSAALRQQHDGGGELDRRSLRDDERHVRARSQRHAAAGHDDAAHDDRSVHAERHAGRRRRPRRVRHVLADALRIDRRARSRCCCRASRAAAIRRPASRGSTRTARRSRRAAATASTRSSRIRRSTSSLSALIVGHELGHNFGAWHTHCTNVATGGAPTGTNTIDKCFKRTGGCYQGATSCPTSGPGAPAGTIMSYCNQLQLRTERGRTCCSSIRRRSATLNALIAQNTPSCLSDDRRRRDLPQRLRSRDALRPSRRVIRLARYTIKMDSGFRRNDVVHAASRASASTCRTGSRPDRPRASPSCCARRTPD